MLRVIAVLFTFALMAPPLVAQQSGRTPEMAEPLPDSAEHRASRPVSFHVSLAGVYESNIDRNEDRLASRGVVFGGGVHYRTAGERPIFSADYEAAVHQYSGTERWDRLSHYLRGLFQPDVADDLHLETIGEIAFKGSSEDRDLSDNFTITQRVGYELTDEVEATAFGGYRYRRAESSEQDARNPFGGIELAVELGDATDVTAEVRRELKSTVNPRFTYNRWRYELEVEQDLGSLGELEIEGVYRDQRYPNRMVEIEMSDGEEEEHPRHDERMQLGVTWTVPVFTDGLELGVNYEYETRASNDEEKEYDAHAIAAVLRYAF